MSISACVQWIDDPETEGEADRLLRAAGAFRQRADGTYLCMEERHLIRRHYRDIASGYDVEWAEEVLLVGPDWPQVTFQQLSSAAHLTSIQRRCIRAMRECKTQTAAAAKVGVTRNAFSQVLARAYLRIQAAYPKLQEQTPEDWAQDLFDDELRHKQRLRYHRPTGHLNWHECDHRKRMRSVPTGNPTEHPDSE